MRERKNSLGTHLVEKKLHTSFDFIKPMLLLTENRQIGPFLKRIDVTHRETKVVPTLRFCKVNECKHHADTLTGETEWFCSLQRLCSFRQSKYPRVLHSRRRAAKMSTELGVTNHSQTSTGVECHHPLPI